LSETLQTILNNPIYLGIAALLVLLVVLALALKFLKLALLAALVLVCYFAVMHFTGQEVPRELSRLEQGLKTKAVEAGKAVSIGVKELGRPRPVERLKHSGK